MKNYIVSALVSVVVVVVGITFFVPKANTVVNQTLGAAGSTFSFPVFFQSGVTIGGGYLATTSANNFTYSANDIARNIGILQISSSAVTGTLPTNVQLSSVGFLPNPGDTYTLFINASTSSLTLAGNTDVILSAASTTKQIAAGQIGTLEFIRMGTSEARRIKVLLTAD